MGLRGLTPEITDFEGVDNWADLFEALEDETSARLRETFYLLDTWKTQPGKRLTEREAAYLALTRGFFRHLRGIVSGIPWSKVRALHVINLTSGVLNGLAHSWNDQHLRRLLDRELHTELTSLPERAGKGRSRTLDRPASRLQPENRETDLKNHLKAAIKKHRHPSGKPNWSKVGRDFKRSDNWARKTAKRLDIQT
jgi:hypothetical protein